jgi:hypothetical protein
VPLQELPQGLPEPAWKAAASCRAASDIRVASGSRVAADIRVGSPWQADLDNPLAAGGNLVEDNLVALGSPAAAASCQAAADTRVDTPSSAAPDNPWAAEGNPAEGNPAEGSLVEDSLVALGSLVDSPAVAASYQAAEDSLADIPSAE